jgi:hypothetical protein
MKRLDDRSRADDDMGIEHRQWEEVVNMHHIRIGFHDCVFQFFHKPMTPPRECIIGREDERRNAVPAGLQGPHLGLDHRILSSTLAVREVDHGQA